MGLHNRYTQHLARHPGYRSHMTSILVKSTVTGKAPTHLIRDLHKWNKYTDKPRSDAELAQKAKELDLVDGLPFIYCLGDIPSGFATNSLVSIDLRTLEGAYSEIYNLCEALEPHSPTIGLPQYQPHAFRPERKSGLTPLTKLLRNQIRFMYDAVTSIEHSLNHDNNAVMAELLKLADSREKMKLLGQLAELIFNFRRDYFAEIPQLLNIIDSEPESDYYLFDYRGSFADEDLIADQSHELLANNRPDLVEDIRQLAVERARDAVEILDNAEHVFSSAETTLQKAEHLVADPEMAELVGQLKDAMNQTDATLASLKEDADAIVKKYAKQDKTSRSAALEKLENSLHTTRESLNKESGLDIEEISVKFPGGFALTTF